MIKFTLSCPKDHVFESWFQSGAAFDALLGKSMIACIECGSTTISKQMMAPSVSTSRGAIPADPKTELTAPATDRTAALAKLKKHVEANSDYVGMNFASEARAMYDGDAPARAIYGEARVDEARKLIEDGVPVAPLPFRPTRQTN